MLLVIGFALLSACNSIVPPVEPEEVISLPIGDSPFDESVPEQTSEPGIETSEPPIESDVSEMLEIPPLGTPSKLIPVLEFDVGIGDGDYELGYSEPDEYGFTFGPVGLWLNKNEILINDCINRRLLVYRDGKLVDKVDTGAYRLTFYCAITDEYYYAIDRFGSVAYRIDRRTKEFAKIDFEAHDCRKDGDYTWRFCFKTVGEDIYIYGYHHEKGDFYYLVDGCEASAAEFPLYKSTVSYEDGEYTLHESDSSQKSLELLKQDYGVGVSTSVMSNNANSAKIIYQELRYRNERVRIAYYNAYYKFSSNGTIIGRYIQFLWNDLYKPLWSTSFGSTDFRRAMTDDGELLVVDGDDEHIGIYKVVFGMDEYPFPT